MRQPIKIGILTFALCCIPLPTCARPRLDSRVTLEEIDLGLGESTLLDWYNAQSGLTISESLLGVYATQPVGRDLYIGNPSRP